MTDDARIIEKALRQLIHAPFLEERDVALRALDRLTAEIARKDEALRAFLHLTNSDDEGQRDQLEGLPDAHAFELCWATEGSGYPQITVGQIKRARAALAPMEKKNG